MQFSVSSPFIHDIIFSVVNGCLEITQDTDVIVIELEYVSKLLEAINYQSPNFSQSRGTIDFGAVDLAFDYSRQYIEIQDNDSNKKSGYELITFHRDSIKEIENGFKDLGL